MRAAATGVVVVLGALGLARPAHAAKARPLFEPTDLELQETGFLEVDAQLGMMRSADGPARAVIPNYEVNLGVLPNLELDVDGLRVRAVTPGGKFS